MSNSAGLQLIQTKRTMVDTGEKKTISTKQMELKTYQTVGNYLTIFSNETFSIYNLVVSIKLGRV